MTRPHEVDMMLYRAANDSYTNPDTTCFAEQREVAEAYTANRGFGGARVYAIDVEIDPATVLDLTEAQPPRWLERVLPTVRACLGSAISQTPAAAEALAERGIKWVRLIDSYPEDAVTMLLVGSDVEIEDLMSECES